MLPPSSPGKQRGLAAAVKMVSEADIDVVRELTARQAMRVVEKLCAIVREKTRGRSP